MATATFEVQLYDGGVLLGRAFRSDAAPANHDWFWQENHAQVGPAVGPFTTIQAAVADLISYFDARTP